MSGLNHTDITQLYSFIDNFRSKSAKSNSQLSNNKELQVNLCMLVLYLKKSDALNLLTSLIEQLSCSEDVKNFVISFKEHIESAAHPKLPDLTINNSLLKSALLPSITINRSNINQIKRDVMGFKKALREEIDRQGGISKVAKIAGLAQPTLSRMLASESMPHASTVHSLFNALNIESISFFTNA